MFAGWKRDAGVAMLAAMMPVCVLAQDTAVPKPKGPIKNEEKATQSTPETRMTKAQSEELFRSVDEILKFASDDSKLPMKQTVKRKLISRDEVNKYLAKKFNDDEGAKRLQRSEIVLKKFGLLDHDFHLGPFLLTLLTEQVAGYYDAKTKTVNLLDWTPAEEQKPVMAHELTHALQDQRVGLEKWGQITKYDISANAVTDNQHIQTDEADSARDAVLEGQAMAVFVDYGLKPLNKTIATNPEVVQRVADAMNDPQDSPVMSRAPLLLQQSLIFPYREGLAFEASLILKRGVADAFAGALDRPPSTSYEIMNPDAYMGHLPMPVLRFPDVHPLLDKEWAPYDVGVMGELDVRMLTELFAGQEIASALAPEWNGGIYYAAQKRAGPQGTTASLGLLYYSRWKDADSARTFARVYAGQLPRKYTSLTRREKDATDGEQVYTTPEGDVLISLDGSGVFISEGFELATARKLAAMTTAMQTDAPLMQTALPQQKGGELGMGVIQSLAGFGAMQAGMHAVEALR